MRSPSTRPRRQPVRHPNRRKRQASHVMKLIVVGLAKTGKSTFIKHVSQYTETQADPAGNPWFFGRVRVDNSLILHFLEPPIKQQFDFFWMRDVVSRIRATGFIVMMDSSRPKQFGQFLSILYTIRGYHNDTPLVVAANKQDKRGAWQLDDIRLGLGIRDIPMQSCIATDHTTVGRVAIDVLTQIRDQ